MGHYHLGMAFAKANNNAMAKKQLEYTLQISPKDILVVQYGRFRPSLPGHLPARPVLVGRRTFGYSQALPERPSRRL